MIKLLLLKTTCMGELKNRPKSTRIEMLQEGDIQRRRKRLESFTAWAAEKKEKNEKRCPATTTRSKTTRRIIKEKRLGKIPVARLKKGADKRPKKTKSQLPATMTTAKDLINLTTESTRKRDRRLTCSKPKKVKRTRIHVNAADAKTTLIPEVRSRDGAKREGARSIP